MILDLEMAMEAIHVDTGAKDNVLPRWLSAHCPQTLRCVLVWLLHLLSLAVSRQWCRVLPSPAVLLLLRGLLPAGPSSLTSFRLVFWFSLGS